MNDQTQIAKIEDRIDQTRAGKIAVSLSAGGIQVNDMRDVMEMAKLMAVSAQAVPKHLRGEPGMCLGICIQAIEWRLSPFAVANKSYVVNDRLAYESQLLHSVVEARAPIVGRLRCSYEGQNGDRTCTVTGLFEGESEPHEYTTPKVKDIKVKNSPLWTSDTDQQLWYYGSRAWARKWCPDVLLGIYTPEEVEQFPAGEEARDVTPNLISRLSGRMTEGQGFHPDNVANGIAGDEHPAAREAHGGKAAGSDASAGPAAAAQDAPTEAAGASADAEIADKEATSKSQPVASQHAGRVTRKPKADKPVPAPADSAPRVVGGTDVDVFPEPWIKKTAAEYTAYFVGLKSRAPNAVLSTEAQIDKRWSDERKIRNALGNGLDEEQMEACHMARQAAKDKIRVPS